ncbi:hypothetical protein [Pseudaestuariivita atlantica]|uniref:hypothetical protein n=1 Tax=Pseudaestuariivita atlantica TaxID=1317121 RepID=UPI00067ADE50|nr:hypothetical protein [Pseudaestuariivita atlantica]
MNRTVMLLLILGALGACDGSTGKDNPFQASDDSTTGTDTTGTGNDTVTGVTGDRTLPPGTANPSPNRAIVRTEEVNESGGGYAENITYNNANGQDEFSVDNLAFDGDNTYNRSGVIFPGQTNGGQLGPFAVYESDVVATDPQTGNTFNTFRYRAIYGRSTSGQTEFAIVRTGSYIDYGFGGFIYQRNATDAAGNQNRLVLPTTGDAEYLGDYAGVRVFQGTTGLEYVRGTAQMFVDFKDFNNSQSGVALFIHDRRLYDINGNDITDAYLTAIDNSSTGGGLLGGGGATANPAIRETDAAGNEVLPSLRPVISPDIADANGEMVGELQSIVTRTDGSTQTLATGTYYAIMSGTNAEEVVGVLVVTETDPRFSGVTAQETGGFIIYRQ